MLVRDCDVTSPVKAVPILVVDDFPLVAATIAGLLRAEGFKDVDVAHGGSAALEKLKRKDYRLVISDMKMPGVSGLELFKALRENGNGLNTRFLLITGDKASADLDTARSTPGVDGILVKPFSPERLSNVLETIFSAPAAAA